MAVFSVTCCKTVSCLGDETGKLGGIICGIELICSAQRDTGDTVENSVCGSCVDMTSISTNEAGIFAV
jgi:hypothetical protein